MPWLGTLAWVHRQMPTDSYRTYNVAYFEWGGRGSTVGDLESSVARVLYGKAWFAWPLSILRLDVGCCNDEQGCARVRLPKAYEYHTILYVVASSIMYTGRCFNGMTCCIFLHTSIYAIFASFIYCLFWWYFSHGVCFRGRFYKAV